MNITTMGIDLAKTSFSLVGTDKHGHQTRIIAVKFVEPYRKGVKNDNNHAEAICEAVRRPNIWYVPVKTEDD